MIEPGVGFIRVNKFAATTYKEFLNSITSLKSKGAKKFIIDLRENSGGLMDQAINMVNEFLPEGRMIVYSKGKAYPRSEAKSDGSGSCINTPVVVLIDEFSASASEIFSGAIQDNDRGLIIGRRSFGKGLVQRQFPLIDGSVMRLTTARYYTPTGRCIQKPYKDGKDEYELDLINRYNKGELLHADSIHFPDSLHYQTLSLKRTVYGGGGIMPDIFVPLDTTRYTDFHRKLVAFGIINKVCVQYVDKNRAELKKKYPTFEKFKKEFEPDDAFLNALITAAEKEKEKEKVSTTKLPKDSTTTQVAPTKEDKETIERENVEKKEFEKSKPLIKLQLKALIASSLWETNEYYQIMDADNESLLKAIEILQTPGAFEKILK